MFDIRAFDDPARCSHRDCGPSSGISQTEGVKGGRCGDRASKGLGLVVPRGATAAARRLGRRAGSRSEPSVVPVARSLRALQLGPLARVLAGAVRRLAARAEHRGPVRVQQGRVPVGLQHVLPRRQGRLHPGRQLWRRRRFDRAVRREGRPGHPKAGLVHAAAQHGAGRRMGLPRSHGDHERRVHLRGLRLPGLQGQPEEREGH